MDDEEKAEMLALMYQSDADDEVEEISAGPKPERPYGIMNMPAMSAAIRRMQETIDAQDRLLKRLNQRVRNLERQNNRLTREVNEIDRTPPWTRSAP